MSGRVAAVVGLLWLGSLVAVAATARGQVSQPEAKPKVEVQALPQDLRILSGDDIGFRLEGWDRSTPTGTLVIRVNGRWVEVATAKKIVPLTR
jgi:hypothetical protein